MNELIKDAIPKVRPQYIVWDGFPEAMDALMELVGLANNTRYFHYEMEEDREGIHLVQFDEDDNGLLVANLKNKPIYIVFDPKGDKWNRMKQYTEKQFLEHYEIKTL